MERYDYLIVGAGLFGAVFAHEAKLAGKRCLVIDKRAHRGGNIYCEDVEGIRVHKYGAHIFPCMVIFNHFIVESCWRLSHSSLVRFHLLCVHSQYCGAFLIICSNCSMNIAVISYSVRFTSGISIHLNVHS